ncbi:hypothetical protein ACLKA7_001455 [Drosophila subpalustris]
MWISVLYVDKCFICVVHAANLLTTGHGPKFADRELEICKLDICRQLRSDCTLGVGSWSDVFCWILHTISANGGHKIMEFSTDAIGAAKQQDDFLN